jgi:PilZ domain
MESAVDPVERRRTPRASDVAEHGIVCARIRPGHAAIVIDLSPEGALIETGHRLLPGTIVVLHCESLDRRESVRGRVLRSVVAGVRANGISYRGAIRFESPLTCMAPSHALNYPVPAAGAFAVHEREASTRDEGPRHRRTNVDVERF